jgi:hypothetical protein
MPVWLAQAFIPLFGLSLASRMPVALYVGAVPLLVGLLCLVTRRSPWFALLIVPFVYDDNLGSGFIAYCLGVALFVASIAWTLHIEAAPKFRQLSVLCAMSIALGFTHPQMVPPTIASVLGIIVLGTGRRKLLIAFAALTSAVPLVVWALQPSAASFRSGKGIAFLSPTTATIGLAKSLDVYTENTEVFFFALFVGVLVLAWAAGATTGHWREHRVALIAFGALVSAYVLPLAWNGQMVSLRMLLPLLVLLPATVPPEMHPCGSLRVALLAIAVLGAAQIGFTVYAFNRDITRELDPLIRASASAPRVAPIVYDSHVTWVNPPVLLHAGAWLVFERGGVYAYSFDALTSHHTDRVPREQRMTERAFDPRRELKQQRIYVAREDRDPYWNAWLVRWTFETPPPAPIFAKGSRWSVVRSGSYTLFQRE